LCPPFVRRWTTSRFWTFQQLRAELWRECQIQSGPMRLGLLTFYSSPFLSHWPFIRFIAGVLVPPADKKYSAQSSPNFKGQILIVRGPEYVFPIAAPT
jgi:hypothetical protein